MFCVFKKNSRSITATKKGLFFLFTDQKTNYRTFKKIILSFRFFFGMRKKLFFFLLLFNPILTKKQVHHLDFFRYFFMIKKQNFVFFLFCWKKLKIQDFYHFGFDVNSLMMMMRKKMSEFFEFISFFSFSRIKKFSLLSFFDQFIHLYFDLIWSFDIMKTMIVR